jgi:glyoxylase-like metal-dependent hydrolase (beta-lactamase superfamily II)
VATGDTEIIELANGVYARLHEGLTNAGIVIGDDGVMLIDSLRVPSFARDLIADVKKLTDKPIRYVVDTHSHWDHSWGNEEFPDSTLVGHANCRREMLDPDITVTWRDKVIASGDPWAEEAKSVRITPPDLTFEDTLHLQFAGRPIDMHWLGRAHTSGDIFIRLPDDGLLFTGDVAQDGGVPYMMDGYLKDWVGTDSRLVELECDRFMAGHGPIGSSAAISEARDFIVTLVGAVEAAIADGQARDAAASAINTSLSERFGGWRGFERVEASIAYAYDQISGA